MRLSFLHYDDSVVVAIGSRKGTVIIWDLSRRITTAIDVRPHWLHDLTVSEDEETIIVFGHYSIVCVITSNF